MTTMQSIEIERGDVLSEDLSVEQLERVSGGKFGLDVLAKVTAHAVWQGVNFVARSGSAAGRGDR